MARASHAAKPAKPPRAPRRRRSPDEARRLLLDAARTLFAAHGPDAVGLKDVARAAGVSHGLVTHYFGTYDGLVEEVFTEHLRRVREPLIAQADGALGEGRAWVEQAFAFYAEPLTARMTAWALLTGRLGRVDSVVAREQGLRQLVDAVTGSEGYRALQAAHHARGSRPRGLERESFEFAVSACLAAALGFQLLAPSLSRALGHAHEQERESAFRQRFAEMITGYLELHTLGAAPAKR